MTSLTLARGAILAGLLLWLTGCPSERAPTKAINPSPAECRAALGFELGPLPTTSAFPPADSATLRLASELGDILDAVVVDDASSLNAALDSVEEAVDTGAVVRALAAIMSTRVPSRGYSAVGTYYGRLGGEFDFAQGLLVDSRSSFTQRGWALSAMESGVSAGFYPDSSATTAIASLLCDMAYLLRPFLSRSALIDTTAYRHFSIAEQERLHSAALSALAEHPELPAGLDYAVRYAQWEPHEGLRARANDLVLYVTDREAYIRQHLDEQQSRDRQ